MTAGQRVRGLVTAAAYCALIAAAASCDSGAATPAADSGVPSGDGTVYPPLVPSHDFEGFDVAPGEERIGDCQSWTLHNPEPIYVNAVHMASEGGFHHSVWYYVPETRYAGDDGTWPCDERGFNDVDAATRGGGALYSQSTQAPAESQQFQPGVALVIPPFSRIVGNVHLLNAGATTLTTHIRLDLDLLDESAVGVLLAPLNFNYFHIDLPPHAASEFRSECDLATTYMTNLGKAVDFHVYYVLPHYHRLGTLFRLEAIGGPHDGETIFESTTPVGEPLGRTLDVPFDMTGAVGFRATCGFNNTTSDRIFWGIGDQEMCNTLVYTDSELIIGAATLSNTVEGTVDGVVLNTGPCALAGARARLPMH